MTGRRAITRAALAATATLALALPAAAGAANVDIYAQDEPSQAFVPADVEIEQGDTVTWHFTDPPGGGDVYNTHNVFLGTDPYDPSDEDVSKCGGDTPDPFAGCLPDVSPPAVRQFTEVGEFPYYCTLHPGMTGTVTVNEATNPDETPPVTNASLSPSPGPGGVVGGPVTVTLNATDNQSGVASTEYKVDGGEFRDYSGPFVVSGDGAHSVQFFSTDNANNIETPKTVEFTIQTSRPSPEPPPGDNPPPRDTTTPPAEPFVAVEKPASVSLANVLRRGLEVEGPCVGVESGTVTLTVKRSAARKLGLRKPVLAKAKVSCGADGRFSAKLKPKGKTKKALKRARGTVKARVKVKLGAVSDATSVKLKGARGKRGR